MKEDVLRILKKAGAILEGHFIGTSGRHLSLYINKDAWLPHTELVSEICAMLAARNKDKSIDIVAGPALGGIPLSQWTADHLSNITGKKVLSVFTEKTADGRQALKRGYDALVKGKRILVVEDTLTTGASVKNTIDAVSAAGGNVVSLSVIINRDPARITEETFGIPFFALADIPSESYAESEVPEWLRKIPITTKVGHGAQYIREYPDAKHIL